MSDAEVRPAERSDVHPFVSFLFASVGYVLLQLALTPIRIKLMTTLLTKEQYGILTLAIMSVSCLAALVSCGSFEYLLRKAPGRSQAVQRGLLRLALTYFGGLSAAVAVVGVGIVGWALPPGAAFPRSAVAAAGFGIVAYLHLLTKAFYLLSCGRPIAYRITQFLYADIWFLPVVALLWVRPLGIDQVLWLWVGWLGLTLLLTWRLTPLRGAVTRGHADVRLRDMVAFGLPLLPMMFGEWLFRLGDRYVVISLLDPVALADYSLCMNIALIVYMIGLNLIALILPDFNRLKNTLRGEALRQPWLSAELRRLFSLMVRYSLALSLIGGTALFLVGPQILLVLSDPKFLDAAVIFPWAAPASLFFLLQAVFNRTLMALDRSRLVGGLTLAGAALNVGLNLVLVPHLQERGAALATCLSLAGLAGAAGFFVRAWRWIEPKELRLSRVAAAALLSAAGMYAAREAVPHEAFVVLAVGGGWSALMMFSTGVIKPSDIRLLLAEKPG